MIRKNDIMTLVVKKEYPYMIEVQEVLEDGNIKCLCSAPDGNFYETFNKSEVRPYSAKELWEDVSSYYHIDEPNINFIHSHEFIAWLKKEIKENDEFRNNCYEECEEEGIDIADMDSSDLWEFDQALEIMGWLTELINVINKEISEIAPFNASKRIDIKDVGYFEIQVNTDEDFPGVDVEFIPLNKTGEEASFPRVLMEYHKEDGVHTHIWGDSSNEDYTMKIKYE